MLTGIPDGSLPDTLASIVKASYLEKLEVQLFNLFLVYRMFLVLLYVINYLMILARGAFLESPKKSLD